MAVITPAGSHRRCRCLYNWVETTSEAHFGESEAAQTHLKRGSLKEGTKNDVHAQTKISDIFNQLKAVDKFSNKWEEDEPFREELKELNDIVEGVKANVGNSFILKDFDAALEGLEGGGETFEGVEADWEKSEKVEAGFETLEEVDADWETYDEMEEVVATPNAPNQTDEVSPDCTLPEEAPVERLKKRLSLLRKKCSDLTEQLSEGEVNELISHLDNAPPIQEEVKIFYEILLRQFKVTKNTFTESLWKKCYHNMVTVLTEEETKCNVNFYKLIKGDSVRKDAVEDLINQSRDSLRRAKKEVYNKCTSGLVSDMKREYSVEGREKKKMKNSKAPLWKRIREKLGFTKAR
ncbi:Plasmodium RESA N-terminal, putative [Plasmodium vivax]|nr:Plasmodium RESA N-terminal, putative [Plasmodium vivax]